MIYPKLLEIEAAISELQLYRDGRIYLGTQFTLGGDQDDLLLIKSGSGLFDGKQLDATVHLMSKLYDASNIEKKVDSYVRDIVRILRLVNDISPVFYTTDADIFLPIGRDFSPEAPHGGFRIDMSIRQIV